MTLHINDAGTWRQIQSVHVNDAGTWRSIQEVHVNDAGTWRKVFSALSVLVHNTTEGGGEGAYATDGAESRTVNFANTGQFAANSGPGTQSYTWLLGGSASECEILFHQTGGTAVSGTPLDVWTNMGPGVGITLTWPGGGSSNSAAIEISIRNATTLAVLVNAVPITMNTHP